MSIFNKIKNGGFVDPTTLQGAIFYGMLFTFLGRFAGRALRGAVQRVLMHNKHDHIAAPTGLETGIVESFTLVYTLLKTDDNRRVVVPNSIMASQTAVPELGLSAICLNNPGNVLPWKKSEIPLPQTIAVLKDDRSFNCEPEKGKSLLELRENRP